MSQWVYRNPLSQFRGPLYHAAKLSQGGSTTDQDGVFHRGHACLTDNTGVAPKSGFQRTCTVEAVLPRSDGFGLVTSIGTEGSKHVDLLCHCIYNCVSGFRGDTSAGGSACKISGPRQRLVVGVDRPAGDASLAGSGHAAKSHAHPSSSSGSIKAFQWRISGKATVAHVLLKYLVTLNHIDTLESSARIVVSGWQEFPSVARIATQSQDGVRYGGTLLRCVPSLTRHGG